MCRAVDHAHRKAVIHRDLEPSNVAEMLVELYEAWGRDDDADEWRAVGER